MGQVEEEEVDYCDHPGSRANCTAERARASFMALAGLGTGHSRSGCQLTCGKVRRQPHAGR